MTIKIFPALNGDSIMLEYADNHYALIDGGYVDTCKNYLQPELKAMAQNGKSLELVVVTHIDSDHISGVLRLFEESPKLIQIDNVWHNAYRHVQSPVKVVEMEEDFIHHNISKEVNADEFKKVSAKQGSTLAAHIQSNDFIWNAQFGGNAVMAGNSISIGDVMLHIISPTSSNIEQLRKFWVKELIKSGLLNKEHSNEFWDDAFDFSLAKDKPGFRFNTHNVGGTTDLENIKQQPYTPDTSATNGSSISFVMEVEGKRLLMLGDAQAETIVEGLRNLYGAQESPIYFDAIKLAHHGSFNNNSPELISMIDSANWIISTNGDTYNHPDIETLAHILTKGGDVFRKLYFNYSRTICKVLNTKELHDKYKFEIIVPKEENEVTLIVLKNE